MIRHYVLHVVAVLALSFAYLQWEEAFFKGFHAAASSITCEATP
ncbi:MAG: hypothetical protein ACKVIS_22275 [Pseudomonadales bacterium]